MHDALEAAVPQLRLNRKQERILLALRNDVPEIAKMYEAGLRLVAEESFPARVYLLGHAMREVINRLPDHYDIPMPARTRVLRVL